MHIIVNKRKIPYTLKVSKRAKRLRLSIHHDGSFIVTTPKNLHLNTIKQFIIKKSQWILDKLDYFSKFTNSFKIKNTKSDFIKYKETAKKLVEEKISKFNKIYKFKFNKINIKNQKTRWGSCSKKGNLNFNYKIALLPEELAEYIVVHELCHLGEFNHSVKFWNLVAKTIPEYLKIRDELKRSGLRFH